MKIGLFFGSFNPVHTGHMIIANQVVHLTDLDQVWMVVSPHNPLKKKTMLANDFDRLHLVNLAIGNNIKIKASNIEFNLPKPSYTIDTLTYLTEKHPEHTFTLIMGGDNLATLHKWKNFEQIVENFDIYLYQRPGIQLTSEMIPKRVKVLSEFPLLDISSTYIRQCIHKGVSIQYLVPDAVFDYLEGSSMYRI